MSVPFQIKTVCDSMSLNIGSWLGIPSLPVVVSTEYVH